ncbi:MAG TPA: hypothetical protein VGX37_00740 [Allosphingosinicella sp.]|jgi:hypothetical protein|nr:hypothetical protein [Allosphingosinicella sp.]
MARVIIGALVATIAMFFIGFIFFNTPLARLSVAGIDDAQAAAVQQSLAANLPKTGTYSVPGVDTPAQTNMFSRGPIATIHYNIRGYAATDLPSLIKGLVLNFLVALLIGAALIGIDRRVPDFGSRARVAVIIAVAASAFTHLGEPIYWHHDWPHFLYLFIADALALSAAGVIIAWFLPRARAAAPADAPAGV